MMAKIIGIMKVKAYSKVIISSMEDILQYGKDHLSYEQIEYNVQALRDSLDQDSSNYQQVESIVTELHNRLLLPHGWDILFLGENYRDFLQKGTLTSFVDAMDALIIIIECLMSICRRCSKQKRVEKTKLMERQVSLLYKSFVELLPDMEAIRRANLIRTTLNVFFRRY